MSLNDNEYWIINWDLRASPILLFQRSTLISSSNLFKTTDATESKTYQNIKHDIIWQLALTVMLQYKCIYSAYVRSVRRNMNLKGGLADQTSPENLAH